MAVSSRKKQLAKSVPVKGKSVTGKSVVEKESTGKAAVSNVKNRGASAKGETPEKTAISTKKPAKPGNVTNKNEDRPRDSPAPEKNGKGRTKAKQERSDKGADRKVKVLYGIIAILFLLLVLVCLKSCGILGGKEMLYEEAVAPNYEPDIDVEETEGRLNLAIFPDYEVSEANPDMLIPYPEQNVYDIDLTFVDPYTDGRLYQTDLIAPGSIISVPAYDFAYDGQHTYKVEVQAYDRDTHELIETSVAMESVIFKR